MKNTLYLLKKDPKFSSVMQKIALDTELDNEELEYVLTCCIFIIKEYTKDRRKHYLFEFAYYIAVKVAVNNQLYSPLLDISLNYGLYPISQYIISKQLSSSDSMTNFSMEYNLEKFNYKNITETFEQKKYRLKITSSKNYENAYIAPTSFGKSSLIIELIDNKIKENSKFCIIVPTKSLLVQTYKNIKKHFPTKNIIFHDEMYRDEDSFIAIFTQERALRLLKEQSLHFDYLIIDEAHNLFSFNSRTTLLTRLIRINRKRNPNSKNYYLSPLIHDSENLSVEGERQIHEHKIKSNIKEPNVTEYRTDGSVLKYDRFLNEFYKKGHCDSLTEYILSNQLNKNFIYLFKKTSKSRGTC
ncbi:DEAD/DEAH box helicase family protein [Photobacterium swingsii]|uniref:DEAD/DEAH box helicase family protein n=1 Tax=Photobacterium swingsii TaxID=680026 RepID=UPI003D124E60